MPRPLAAALALLAAAPAAAFDASGEIASSTGGSAAWDAERIVGPLVNLTLMDGGAWAGDLRGQNVALTVRPDRLTAPNVDLHVERTARSVRLLGNAFGRRYNLEWDAKGLSGRVGPCSVELERSRSGLLVGQIGCSSGRSVPFVTHLTLRLAGEAALVDPPMPRFALALIAVLP